MGKQEVIGLVKVQSFFGATISSVDVTGYVTLDIDMSQQGGRKCGVVLYPAVAEELGRALIAHAQQAGKR